jgi:hypothetical protein
MMQTVGELIRALQQFNPSTPIELLIGNQPATPIVRVETFPHFQSVYITGKQA